MASLCSPGVACQVLTAGRSFVPLRATTERLNSSLKASCDNCVLKGPRLLPSRNSGKHDGLLAAEVAGVAGQLFKANSEARIWCMQSAGLFLSFS
jgi:hypothetical protein